MTFPIRLVAAIGAGPEELAGDPAVQEEIEAALVTAGYPATPIGWRSFQRNHGLPVTDTIDPDTLDLLGVRLR